MTALNRKLVRDLRRMWSQVAAIIMVTVAGTCAYIMLVGAADSIQQTQDAYYERYRFADVFVGVQRAPNSVAEKLALIDGVKSVSTSITYSALVEVPEQQQPANCMLASMPAEGGLNQLHLRRGRLVTPGSPNEVIVTEAFARAHNLQPGATLWATLKGQRRKLEVVGVGLSPEHVFFGVPGAMIPDERLFGILWMDRRAMEEAYDMEGAFNTASLSVTGTVSVGDVIGQVDALLSVYGGTGAYGRPDQVSHATITSDIKQLRATIRYAAPVFIGIVAFLLHMLMMRHIDTERERIGALKAFGYTDHEIVWHYLKFVLIIVVTGVVIGMVLGAELGRVVTAAYAKHFHFPFLAYSLSPEVFLQATAIEISAALIGCGSSLWRAARLPPAVAMRSPPPPVYHRTAFERFIGRVVSDQLSRVVVRQIIRWPLRTGMTMFAIAAATSILVAPLGVLTSSNRMVDVHFFQAERQDLTVAFGRAPAYSAATEIAHYPGVMVVEPFRNATARVEFNGRKRRVMVLGRQSVTDLSRPLDKTGTPIHLPEEGIVISAAMADWLGARPGDHITLHFLEDRQRTVQVPVVALAESYRGMTFFMMYMNAETLRRILGESRVNGVHAKIDPTQLPLLWKELKETPAVTGTISHSGSLEAMRRAMDQAMKITWLNVAVAGIIIFGAVYNSARISLAERSRDFASMRLLGYTRWEVSYILLAELAILSLAALPLGCGLGYWLAYLLTEGTANEMFRIPLWIKLSAFGKAALSVLAIVGLSGLFVCLKLMKLDLVSALKTKE